MLALVVFLVMGPEKLPDVAKQFARVVREVRRIARGAQDRVRTEMGSDYDELKKLDPRRYDPQRIMREALRVETTPTGQPGPSQAQNPASPRATGAVAAAGSAGAAAAASIPADVRAQEDTAQPAPPSQPGEPLTPAFDDEAT